MLKGRGKRTAQDRIEYPDVRQPKSSGTPKLREGVLEGLHWWKILPKDALETVCLVFFFYKCLQGYESINHIWNIISICFRYRFPSVNFHLRVTFRPSPFALQFFCCCISAESLLFALSIRVYYYWRYFECICVFACHISGRPVTCPTTPTPTPSPLIAAVCICRLQIGFRVQLASILLGCIIRGLGLRTTGGVRDLYSALTLFLYVRCLLYSRLIRHVASFINCDCNKRNMQLTFIRTPPISIPSSIPILP